MMATMKKLLFAVAVATPLFFACEVEMVPVEQDENPVALASFTASIEDVASPTKADLSGSNLVWATGDKIGIFVSTWGTKNQPFTLASGAGSSTASFVYDYDGGVFTDPSATAAYFPWGGDNHIDASNGKYYIELLQHNGSDEIPTYTSGKLLTPLVAQVTRTGDAYDPIEFKQAGAAVKLTINNLPVGAHSVSLTADQPIYGYFNIDPTNVGSGMVENNPGDNDGKTTTWLHFAPPADETPFTFVFPVPALTTPTLTFSIYDKNDILVWSRTASTQSSIGRAQILAMPALDITPYREFDDVSAFVFSGDPNSWADMKMVTNGTVSIAKGITFADNGEFKIHPAGDWSTTYPDMNYVVVTGGTYDIFFNNSEHTIALKESGCPYPAAVHRTTIRNATDLGATETANCYVIKSAGKYKIPGVKGNSATSVGTIAGVELLWETFNNATTPETNSIIAAVDYDEITNAVYFKTPDVLQPGNALIAAKDGSGNILWSWHIWIPSSAITDIGEYAVSSKYYMDRNLGALTVATASTTVDVAAESFGMFYQWGRKDPFIGARAKGSGSLAKYKGTTQNSTSESVDMDYAIAHPTTMAKNDNWNDGITDRWGQGSSKTIYDPCPAGYRIPEYNSSEVLWQDVTSQGSFVANGAHGWWKVGSSFIFPMAGDGGYDYAEHAFDRTKLWTAKQLDDEHPQYGLGQYIYYKNTDPKDTWTIDELGSWQSKPSWGVRKRYFASVRCQKIEGEVPAPDIVGATSVVMDGSFSDWAGADAISTDSGRLPEWKFGWDASNLYLYFKVTKNRIDYNETSKDYDWESYIYVGIDTDNNAATGARVGGGTDMETGGEVKILIYPWRGNYDADNLSIVSGVDSQSSIQRPVGTTLADVHASIKGDFVGEYCYLEVSIPRSALGELSSKIAVAPCMNYSSSKKIVIPVYD